MAWGMTGVFIQLMPSIDPMAIVTARLLVSLLVMMVIAFFLPSIWLDVKSAAKFMMSYLLIFLLSGYYLLATIAFQMTSVSIAALLLSTPPLFILVLEHIYKASVPRYKWINASVAMAGMAIILLPNVDFSLVSMFSLWAVVMGLLASFLMAAYIFVYRESSKLKKAPPVIGVSVLTFMIGGFFALLLASFYNAIPSINSLTGQDIGLILGVSIISTVIPTIGLALVSGRLPAIISSSISLFIPVFAIFFAYILLGDEVTLTLLFGVFLLILGMWNMTKDARQIVR